MDRVDGSNIAVVDEHLHDLAPMELALARLAILLEEGLERRLIKRVN